MSLKFGKDTKEIWIERLKNYTAGNPEDTIADLLRGVAGIVDNTISEDTPLDVIFELLRDNADHAATLGMLGLKFSDMEGKIPANDDAAKILSVKIGNLLKDGIARNAKDIEAHCFPGIDLRKTPQNAADLNAAYKLVYLMPNIIRLSKDGTRTNTRWTTLQYSPAKPAPLTPKS